MVEEYLCVLCMFVVCVGVCMCCVVYVCRVFCVGIRVLCISVCLCVFCVPVSKPLQSRGLEERLSPQGGRRRKQESPHSSRSSHNARSIRSRSPTGAVITHRHGDTGRGLGLEVVIMRDEGAGVCEGGWFMCSACVRMCMYVCVPILCE